VNLRTWFNQLRFLGMSPLDQPCAVLQRDARYATGTKPLVDLLAADTELRSDLAGGEARHSLVHFLNMLIALVRLWSPPTSGCVHQPASILHPPIRKSSFHWRCSAAFMFVFLVFVLFFRVYHYYTYSVVSVNLIKPGRERF